MAKALWLGIVVGLGSAGFGAAGLGSAGLAFAQASPAPADTSDTASPGVRSGNITSTGETVPNPGASQSAGTTDLDRGIQREDNKIQSGICKGC